MKKHGLPFRRSGLVILTIGASILVLTSVGVWSGSSANRKGRGRQELMQMAKDLKIENLRVKNKTQAFQVTSLEKPDNGSLRISLRNQYEKRISSFQVSIGRVQTEVEFMYNEDLMIVPGATYVETLPIQGDVDMLGIGILAVVFDDGTSDGEPRFISEILEKRLGERMQISRALSLIREVRESGKSTSVVNFDSLESKISSLAENRGDGRRGNFEFGLHDGKLRMLDAIRDVVRNESKLIETNKASVHQHTGFGARQKLDNIVERYERILSQP